ncbi:MAG: transcriptional regulator GcvA [Granulosicoccaceae bacterium]
MEKLPPLNALRTFEVTARHLSLAEAAKELHVTPAAVSLQIKTLEEYLGVKVFHRLPRGLALTDEAERSLPTLQRGFARLQEATRLLRTQNQNDKLDLWSAPAFASKWLMPRLSQFNRLHPGIDMNIHASDNLNERQYNSENAVELLRRRQVDVAIVFGQGQYPGFRADKLFDVHAVPLCSPSLRSGQTPLQSAEDLRFHHLLHDDSDIDGHHSWEDWFAKTGIDGGSWERGTHFNQVQLALEAAVEQQGVLLSLDLMAQRDISAGRLCIPFGPALPLNKSYYLIRPQYRQHEATEGFCQWMLDQVRLSKQNPLPSI